jgi:hypothetical protein
MRKKLDRTTNEGRNKQRERIIQTGYLRWAEISTEANQQKLMTFTLVVLRTLSKLTLLLSLVWQSDALYVSHLLTDA